MTFRTRSPGIRLFLIALAAVPVLSCGPGNEAAESAAGSQQSGISAQDRPAPAGLPGIAAIGGVQDVWPFSFGLDSDRTVVESALGAPTGTRSRPAGDSETSATVVTWEYPGVSFTFFVDGAAQVEELLTARIASADVAVGGGLAVGMSEEEAVALLGEPGYRSGDDIVYFYYSTTIELVVRRGRVVEIALARALP